MYVQNKDGKMNGSVKKPRRGRRLLGIISAILIAIPLIGQIPAVNDYQWIADWFSSEVVYVAEAAEIVPSDTTLEKMKADVLKELQLCESAGKTGVDAEELITYDPDKSGVHSRIPSFGPFQFKIPTMQHYYEKMTGEKLSKKEAILKAMDMVEAGKVAEFVIFTSDKAPSNDWFHCSNSRDLDRKSAYINKYDK